MPAVFVHGVPVTSMVWTPLFDALDRADAMAVQLPGFGTRMPSGLDPTMDGYVDWLADAIVDLDDVDLVGHDWGGLLILRLVSLGLCNVRSWIVDSGNLTPDFAWHDGARSWQTRGSGEDLARWLGTASLEDRVDVLRGIGVTPAIAATMASALDLEMTAAVLTLYRSAERIGAAWGPGLDGISAPGLCIDAGRDPYRPAGAVRSLSVRLNADLLELEDCGHFWMLDAPERVASAMEQFWDRLNQ